MSYQKLLDLGKLLVFLTTISSCQMERTNIEIVPGVSRQIADFRSDHYSDVHYSLFFDIPLDVKTPIKAQLNLQFNLEAGHHDPLILDFNADQGSVGMVQIDADSIPFQHEKEHIVIPNGFLKIGMNQITIFFTAGDMSLNRNKDYLYTLFVPDRASTAFPCFDQPDLKARFTLTLEIPSQWEAVSNYSLNNVITLEGRKKLFFNETAPLPTYLFAFAAGKFKKAKDRSDMPMTMYYRETDSIKVVNNLKEIFNLHKKAIRWMEEYTSIKFPFEKFDFVLIPPFQYGGMEHPGSIFYRERSLFLDEAATLNEKLGRASLISHETAHMWFGDLVTMKWFNDVWSKEVFANFMADKIVNPSFKEINHDLKFLFNHYPSAYSVDRTRGANAIRQPLDNLKNAGLMYGPIIYNKAPVMMKHLEAITGEDAFRDGMREYLKKYSYKNADWNDLIEILDERTDTDLHEWSAMWIEQPGMPKYTVDYTEQGVSVNQEDPLERDRLWMQELGVLINGNKEDIFFDKPQYTLDFKGNVEYVQLNGGGKEYGSFILDDISLDHFLKNVASIDDDFLRGRVWLDFYETFLDGRIPVAVYYNTLLTSIGLESNPLILNQNMGNLRTVFWKFFDQQKRLAYIGQTEKILLDRISTSGDLGIKISLLRTYWDVFLTESAWERLFMIWQKRNGFQDIPLSPSDYTSIAMQLCLRNNHEDTYHQIIDTQLERLTNPDMKNRLEFIKSAVDPDAAVRDQFFETLKDPQNRENEPWVVTALGYLHHPLREDDAIKYIGPSLEMIHEIQMTGDIFFPGRWLDATLGGHQTKPALVRVDDFIGSQEFQALDPKLQLKVWVSSDMLRRCVQINNNEVNNSSL